MNNMRQYGMSNPSQLGSIGVLGTGGLTVPTMLALASVYVGLDFPGSRTVAKNIKKFLKEPIPTIQTGLLLIGTTALVVKQFQNA